MINKKNKNKLKLFDKDNKSTVKKIKNRIYNNIFYNNNQFSLNLKSKLRNKELILSKNNPLKKAATNNNTSRANSIYNKVINKKCKNKSPEYNLFDKVKSLKSVNTKRKIFLSNSYNKISLPSASVINKIKKIKKNIKLRIKENPSLTKSKDIYLDNIDNQLSNKIKQIKKILLKKDKEISRLKNKIRNKK